MSEKYLKVEINGKEENLPKTKGVYMICNRQSFYMQTRFNPKLKESIRVWLKEVIWYEFPLPDAEIKDLKNYVKDILTKGIIHPNPLTPSELKVIELCSEYFRSRSHGDLREELIKFLSHYQSLWRSELEGKLNSQIVDDYLNQLINKQ